MDRFLKGVGGPVMKDMRRRGENVERIARYNADGAVLRAKTGLTRDLMQTVVVLDRDPYVKVGTTRTDVNGFSYPAYWDQHPDRLKRPGATGKRWLTDALRDGFNS